MSEICKNCENPIEMNFCSMCGQRKAKRIDHNYLKDEIQYTVFHMNKGFFFTMKKLISNPGKMAREFVSGNRVNHYKPLLLVFMLSGITAFLAHALIPQAEIYTKYYETQAIKPPFDVAEYSNFIMKYYAFVMLLNIPFMALFTWLAFKKWGYNYYENVIIDAYYFSLVLVFSMVVVLPVQYILKDSPDLYMLVPTLLSIVGMVGIFFWFYIGLYNTKDTGSVILRSVLLFSFSAIVMMVLLVGAGVIYAVFFMNK